MLSTNVTDLKKKLTGYLAKVKQGETVLITERGEIVARLTGEQKVEPSIMEKLMELAKTGAIEMPTRPINRRPVKPMKIKGKPLSEIVIEDRR